LGETASLTAVCVARRARARVEQEARADDLRPGDVARARRVGVDQQPQRHADHAGVHPRGEGREPHQQPDQHVDRGAPEPDEAQREQGQEQRRGGQQRHDVDVVGVEQRDRGHRADVVHDRQGQQEHPQLVRAARPDQGQHPDHHRGVGGDRDAPRPCRRPARVEQQEQRGRHGQPAHRGQRRGGDRAGAAQLPSVVSRLISSPTLKKNSTMSPSLTQWRRSSARSRPPTPMRKLHVPELLVTQAEVGPHERDHRRRQQQRRRPRLVRRNVRAARLSSPRSARS
jgi:hypothetical protein